MPSQFPNPMNLSSLNGANGFKLDGISGDSSGWSVSSAGDVNGDRIADILIGAFNGNGNAGKTYVVFGQRTAWASSISLGTLNGTNGFKIDGVASGDQSGTSVSTAGDVNGDGIADIIIGAPAASSSAGKTYVVFGKNTPWITPISLSTLNGTNGFELDGVASYDNSGYSVSTAGDINGDGIADILIGAQRANSLAGSLTGKTYVVFGKSTPWTTPISLSTLNGTNGFELDGVAGYDQSGYFVSAAGDVNGDGTADILIGAVDGNTLAGKIYVVFGKAGWTSPISLSTLNGTNGFQLNGAAGDNNGPVGFGVASAAGDVNGDGIADIIIGAPAANSLAGKTYVVFGKNTPWTTPISLSTLNGTNGFTLNGVSSLDRSGYSVSTAGDINGDGIADILIGAAAIPSASYSSGNTGKTYVVFGQNTAWASSISLGTLNGTNGFEIDGVPEQSPTGRISVSAAGDVNGDGVTDILIGASYANSNAGATYVVFGNSPSTSAPTLQPTVSPTLVPTAPTLSPTVAPTTKPTFGPTMVPTTQPTFVPTAMPTMAPTTQPTAMPTVSPTAQPTVAPTAMPTVAPSTQPTVAPTVMPTAMPTVAPSAQPSVAPSAKPTFAPTAAPSTRAPSASVVSSASRTSPNWFLPISQAVSLLDSTVPAAYQSVSGYLSGLDASSQTDTHSTSYTSSSLGAVSAQLMLGAVALKLAQKGINWAKGFWASEPALKAETAPALSEVPQSVQQGSNTVSTSTTPDLRADMKHLSEKMEAYQACLEEASTQSRNVIYPDFQKPSINFAYNAGARKRTPSSAEQAVFTHNNAQLATLGR